MLSTLSTKKMIKKIIVWGYITGIWALLILILLFVIL